MMMQVRVLHDSLQNIFSVTSPPKQILSDEQFEMVGNLVVSCKFIKNIASYLNKIRN